MPPKRKASKAVKSSKKPIKSKAIIESDDDRVSDSAASEVAASDDNEVSDDNDTLKNVKSRLRKAHGSTRERLSTPVSAPLTGQKRSAPRSTVLSEDDNDFVPSPIHDSPSKKRRVESKSPIKSANKDVLKTPTKTSPSKRRMQISESEPENLTEDSGKSDNEWSAAETETENVSERQQIFNKAIAKAKDEIDQRPQKGKKRVTLEPLSEDTVYFEDLNQGPVPPSSVIRPSVCAVLDKKLIDPLLKHTYAAVGKLPGGYQNFGWRDIAPGDEEPAQEPMLALSKIKLFYPEADVDYLINLITFTMDRKTNVVNLSRVAFEDLKIDKPSPKSSTKMVYLVGHNVPTLCVCVASVYQDATKEATGGLFPTKTLFAIMHKQEYEYKIANLCILFKVPYIRSQIDNNRWAFSTRPSLASDSSTSEQSSLRFASSSSSPKKSALTSGIASPANSSRGTGQTSLRSTTRYSLSANDTVPIFDARQKKIQLPHGIRDIPKNYPLFKGLVPDDAVVLIGYSTAAFNGKRTPDDISISLNIVWAAVLLSEDPKTMERSVS